MKIPKDSTSEVISVLTIIKKIKNEHTNIDIVVFGLPEILIEVNKFRQQYYIFRYIKIILVCIVLFLGAAIAIINFHQDVDMEGSLKVLYYIITGTKVERPLLIQIPYSIGLGIGMATFFKHFKRKKNKKSPSPLELEMHMYNKNIDDYVLDITKIIKVIWSDINNWFVGRCSSWIRNSFVYNFARYSSKISSN